MEQRFETFTVLINRIGRSIKRLKAGQMAQLELKGPYVSCLYYLYRCGPMTNAAMRIRRPFPGPWILWSGAAICSLRRGKNTRASSC